MEKSKGKKDIRIPSLLLTNTQIPSKSFAGIKSLSLEIKSFVDIYLINKTSHRISINKELIGFIYKIITFKTFHMEA